MQSNPTALQRLSADTDELIPQVELIQLLRLVHRNIFEVIHAHFWCDLY